MTIPFQLLLALILRQTFDSDDFGQLIGMNAAITSVDQLVEGGNLTVIALLTLGPLLASLFASIALGQVVAEAALGRELGVGPMLVGAARRLPVVAIPWVVVHVAIAIGTMMLFIPGLIIAVAFYLMGPVVGVEAPSMGQVFSRPFRLARGKPWRLLAVWSLTALVFGILTPVSAALPWLISQFADPSWLWILRSALAAAMALFAAAATGAISVVAYLDLRARLEGLDLELATPSAPGRGVSIVALGDLPPNEHDPDGIRGAADDILSGADYDRADPDWLDEVWEWILERLNELFGRLELPGVGSGGGSSGLSWLLLVVGAGLLIWLIVRYRRDRCPGTSSPSPPSCSIPTARRTTGGQKPGVWRRPGGGARPSGPSTGPWWAISSMPTFFPTSPAVPRASIARTSTETSRSSANPSTRPPISSSRSGIPTSWRRATGSRSCGIWRPGSIPMPSIHQRPASRMRADPNR